mgnify:FL=1
MADDQVEFDTDEEEVSVEVDTPSNDEDVVLTGSDEVDEFDKAQNATQKRINQLTKKMRQAEREKDEALRYAQSVQGEANSLKARVDELDSGYVNEFSGRVQSELSSAENDLRNSIEIGDTDGVVSAQRKITTLAIQADRAAQAQRNGEMQRQHAELQRQHMQQQAQQLRERPQRGK